MNLTKKLISIVFLVSAAYIGWFLGPYIFSEERLPNNLAFEISDRFSRVNLSTNEYFSYKLNCKVKECDDLIKNLDKKRKKANIQLSKYFDRATEKYGNSLLEPIGEFKRWEKSFDYSSSDIDTWRNWSRDFYNHKEQIQEQLRLATGIYNLDSREKAKVMMQVPMAKKMLEGNPDDSRLCTVMKDYPARSSRTKISAQRIAYIDIGDKFCPKYYHKYANWGELGKKHNTLAAAPYAELRYSDYYNNEVIPRYKKTIEKILSDKNFVSELCLTGGLIARERDPRKDVWRVIYRNSSESLCPKLSVVEKKDYDNSSLSCLMFESWRCEGYNGACDAIERCKPTNGPVFIDANLQE